MLHIKDCTVVVQNKIILESFSLVVPDGSIQVIQGPNGSGKSSLINTIAGHAAYCITSGSLLLDTVSIQMMSPHERAQRGIFVVLQQQVIIPGLSIVTFLYEAYRALKKDPITLDNFRSKIEESFDFVGLDRSFIQKTVGEGFSGGQKKRFELVQILL